MSDAEKAADQPISEYMSAVTRYLVRPRDPCDARPIYSRAPHSPFLYRRGLDERGGIRAGLNTRITDYARVTSNKFL